MRCVSYAIHNSITPQSSSNLPSPQAPQVLLDALKGSHGPPVGAAQPPSPMENLMSMFGGMGSQASNTAPSSSSLPVTVGLRQMVTKWATQLGHKAYYEAHGCVDPSTTLHGRHGKMAAMAMMLGCNSPQAGEVCDVAQLAHGGPQGANARLMMEMLMPRQTKTMLEQCLTPSTLMNGFMGGAASQQEGLTPPNGAAGSPAGHKQPVDCSAVTQMLMMSPTAAEGLMSPESLEQIGHMRNKYLKMACQENMILGTLPYRLCCPGHVRPPTMEEAMMIRSMAAGA
ncbi:uncharacterized protein LOC131947004 isoform X2 [Physella acuta]|uniref:uncharacterized protein LOC131947004 isoform X2 n=1 Tax=Physella acuta TaxID=109671 RepID=UPI0027DADBAE|nr:uncharacterized protein LOC131947004 isoform X2 [Physella acuta]